jgi:hypothetical protein
MDVADQGTFHGIPFTPASGALFPSRRPLADEQDRDYGRGVALNSSGILG